jgi:hypothetical protein
MNITWGKKKTLNEDSCMGVHCIKVLPLLQSFYKKIRQILEQDGLGTLSSKPRTFYTYLDNKYFWFPSQFWADICCEI